MGAILSIIEAGIFITAGCLATMRLLLSIVSTPKPRAGINLKPNEWHPASDTSQVNYKSMVSTSSELSSNGGQTVCEPEDTTEPAGGQTLC
jgi:hypothetical protein